MIAEHEAVEARRVEVEDPRQVLTLVAIDQRHAMATQGELSAEHVDGRRPTHATLRVQDRERGGHVGDEPSDSSTVAFQSNHWQRAPACATRALAEPSQLGER